MANIGQGTVEVQQESNIKTEVVDEPRSACGELTAQLITPTIKAENDTYSTYEEKNVNVFGPMQTLYPQTCNTASASITSEPSENIRIKQELPACIPDIASTEACSSNPEQSFRCSDETHPVIEPKKYNCKASGCPFKTDAFHSFRRHRVYHQVFHKFKGHLKCSYCSFCCNTQTTLTWHLFQHIDAQNNCGSEANDGSRTFFFECQYCFMKCDSRRKLSLHLKLHKKSVDPKDKTNRTRRKDWKSKLKKHIASCLKPVRGPTKKCYQCPECPYKAKVKNRLGFIIHFIQHMTIAGEECSHCTYKSTILGIKSHLLVHLRKKPMLKCCSCHQRFRIGPDLLRHLRQEHSLVFSELTVVLRRDAFASSDISKNVVLVTSKDVTPQQVLEELITSPSETDQSICDKTVPSTDSITSVIETRLEVTELGIQAETPFAENINSKIGIETEKSNQSCTSVKEECSSEHETEEVDTVKAIIFDGKYYDKPDLSIFTQLICDGMGIANTLNPFSELETECSSTCYIFSDPIDENVQAITGIKTPNEFNACPKENLPKDVVISSQQVNNSVPSITITITGNGNSADLLQPTVIADILKSLEFSKFQSNNDENGNLDKNSLDEIDTVPEKHSELIESVDLMPINGEIMEADCLNTRTNINMNHDNIVETNVQNDENYMSGSFSSAFSEQVPHEDSSNEELSDVPKETDLLFDDIVGRLMEEGITEETLKHNGGVIPEKITTRISKSNELSVSKELENETFCYDDNMMSRNMTIINSLINYSESQGDCLEFFQNQEQCENEINQNAERENSRGTEDIEMEISANDNSSNEDIKPIPYIMSTTGQEKSNQSNATMSNGITISRSKPDVEVSQLSDAVILFDYTKFKKATPLSFTLDNESCLDNHSSTNSEVPFNGTDSSQINVNIQDMQVVFDVPVENESDQPNKRLQNGLNTSAIEFFVIPTDGNATSSIEISPEPVAFEQVSSVPAVLELIGATCEVRSTSSTETKNRFLDNGVPEMSNAKTEETYSDRSNQSNFNERSDDTTILIQNGTLVTETSKCLLDTLFCCKYCPVRFSNEKQLILHQHLHRSKLGVKCPFCTYRANKTIILKHLLFHAVQMETVYKCPLCGTKKRNIVFLLDHLKVDHSREIFKAHDALCKRRNFQTCNGCCGSYM